MINNQADSGPLAHMRRAQAVQSDHLRRATQAMAASLQLAAYGFDAATVAEISMMQAEIFNRVVALQKSWEQGWAGWAHYASEVKGMNTASKLLERQCNIFGQATALLMRQMVDITGLQENISVDYTFWVSERLGEKRAQHQHA
jgi:hypothetical protein